MYVMSVNVIDWQNMALSASSFFVFRFSPYTFYICTYFLILFYILTCIQIQYDDDAVVIWTSNLWRRHPVAFRFNCVTCLDLIWLDCAADLLFARFYKKNNIHLNTYLYMLTAIPLTFIIIVIIITIFSSSSSFFSPSTTFLRLYLWIYLETKQQYITWWTLTIAYDIYISMSFGSVPDSLLERS